MNFNVPVKKAVFKYKIEDNFFVFHYENTEDQNTLSGSFYLGDEDHYYHMAVVDMIEYVVHHLGLPISVGIVDGHANSEYYSKLVVVNTMDESRKGFRYEFKDEDAWYSDYSPLEETLWLVGIETGELPCTEFQ